MRAKCVGGDEPGGPGEPVRYAVALHLLMRQDEIELWQSLADRCRLVVDDVIHTAALWGLQYRLNRALASRKAADVATSNGDRSAPESTTKE